MTVTNESVQKACQAMEHQASRLARRLPPGLSQEDLLSAGGMALARAAREFDPALGFPFEHYAARCVRGAMLQEIRQQARRNRRQRPLEVESDDGRLIPLPDPRATDPAEQAQAREMLVPTRKRNTIVLTQVRAASPGAAEVGQMVERLRLAMFDGVSEQDVAAVMRSLVERAKDGNVAAARLLLDCITGGRSGCTVQQAVIVNPPSPDDLS